MKIKSYIVFTLVATAGLCAPLGSPPMSRPHDLHLTRHSQLTADNESLLYKKKFGAVENNQGKEAVENPGSPQSHESQNVTTGLMGEKYLNVEIKSQQIPPLVFPEHDSPVSEGSGAHIPGRPQPEIWHPPRKSAQPSPWSQHHQNIHFVNNPENPPWHHQNGQHYPVIENHYQGIAHYPPPVPLHPLPQTHQGNLQNQFHKPGSHEIIPQPIIFETDHHGMPQHTLSGNINQQPQHLFSGPMHHQGVLTHQSGPPHSFPNSQQPLLPAGMRPTRPLGSGCSCGSTQEYNPVCATNRMTYMNPGKYKCAKLCGQTDIEILHYGICL